LPNNWSGFGSGAEDEKPYDWAVVFVHGIGHPAAGATMRRFGEPFGTFAAAQFNGPSTRLEPHPDGWRLTLDDGTQIRRWLLIELRWADLVVPVRYSALLRWLVLVAPWILHSDALSWSTRRPRRPKPRFRQRMWRSTLRWLTVGVYALLWAVVRSLSLLLLGVVAQLVLTVVGLVGLLPVLRPVVRRAQRLLVTTVGDSYAFVQDRRTWSLIQERLQAAIADGSRQADYVAVVTHSQGTAVMHRTLVEADRGEQPSAWLSLGSGLQKLSELQAIGTSALLGWALTRFAGVVAIVATIPGWERIVDPTTGADTFSDPLGYALVVALALLYAPLPHVRRLRRRVEARLRAPLSSSSMRWIDLYTRYDPVPAGPLPGASNDLHGNPVSLEVHNLGSYLRDHSAYPDNHEEVNATLFGLLCEGSRLGYSAPERRARVAIRRALWLLTSATAVALAAGLIRLVPSPVAVVLGAPLFAFLSIKVFLGSWARWNRRAAAASLRGHVAEFGRARLILAGLWILVSSIGGLAGTELAGGARTTAALAVAMIVVGIGWLPVLVVRLGRARQAGAHVPIPPPEVP
jgi:hypothetical protein